MASDVSIAVYKLGGSLLSMPGLAPRLRALIASAANTRPLLLTGGGPAADLVRDWDRLHDLSSVAAHELAMRSLRLNDALVCTLLPECRHVASREAVEACWNRGRLPVLDALSFLDSEPSLQGDLLAQDWTVTSDSIAAWVTIHWPADRLILLKSRDVPTGLSWNDAAGSHLVDACFPTLVDQVKSIGWVNLRSERPLEIDCRSAASPGGIPET